VSNSDFKLYAQTRHLSDTELIAVSDVFDLNPGNKDLRHYVKKVFDKDLTTQDVVNARARLAAAVHGQKVNDIDSLLQILTGVEADGGKMFIHSSTTGEVDLICFATADMIKAGAGFSEMLFIDGTYKVNKYGFPLYQIMVEDNCGHGRCIMYAFLASETRSAISKMLSVFLTFFPNCQQATQVVMVDKDFKEIEAIKEVLGEQVHILLCLFHVLKAMKKKISELVIPVSQKQSLMDTCRQIVHAQSREEIQNLLPSLSSSPEFLLYFELNWMSCVEL